MGELLQGPDGCTEVLDADEHRILFRHTTRHVGRMAGPHWHPVLAERFTVVGGVVRFRLDGVWRDVGPGQTVAVEPRQVHDFCHDGPGELSMEHEVRPPGRHREMFEVLHALHVTGRLTRSGLPRDPLVLGLVHAQDPDLTARTRTVLGALVSALTTVPDERAVDYASLVLDAVPDAARAHLEELLSTQPHIEDSYLARRWRAQGEARGEARGEAHGRAAILLRILERRGVEVPESARTTIVECTDLARLETWSDRALGASTIDDVLVTP